MKPLRRCKFKLRILKPWRFNKHSGLRLPRTWITTSELDGLLHEFAVEYDEYDTGPGHYTYAVVEDMKGHLHKVREFDKYLRFLPVPRLCVDMNPIMITEMLKENQ